MFARQRYFFYLCCLVAFAYGCDRSNVPLNKLSEKEIKKILHTELPIGSSFQQVENFLKENKIEYAVYNGKQKIGSVIRPPMGMFVFLVPHEDYSVTFYFDKDDKLLKYDWKIFLTGL